MNLTSVFNTSFVKRKLATLALVLASVGAFATLGDGGKKGGTKTGLLSSRQTAGLKTFTLRSGYDFRGSHVLTHKALPAPSGQIIVLDTRITFQRGNATYVLPLKKKVLVDSRVTLRPAKRP